MDVLINLQFDKQSFIRRIKIYHSKIYIYYLPIDIVCVIEILI
jgi:hypothetical protein